MRSMPSDEGFYSCSIFFQLVRDRYVKMLLDTNGGFAPQAVIIPRFGRLDRILLQGSLIVFSVLNFPALRKLAMKLDEPLL